MADYREISQEYAYGAIKASILINGGAAAALLSQVADLLSAGVTAGIVLAMLCWSVGVFLGGLGWVSGFLSSRYYDKSVDEKVDAHRVTSNRWLAIGVAAIVLSLSAFLGGAGVLACSFWPGGKPAAAAKVSGATPQTCCFQGGCSPAPEKKTQAKG